MKIKEYLNFKILKRSFSNLWMYLAFIIALFSLIRFYFPDIDLPLFLNWKLSILVFICFFIISYYQSYRKSLIKDENKTIIDLLKEKDNLSSSLTKKEKELFKSRIKNKEWEITLGSLKNKSLLKENLIRKYSDPLPIILFQYGNQKINKKNRKFISEELEKRYDIKSLGGSLKVIPPKKVPKNLKTGKDLGGWFHKKIQSKYKNASCVISVLAILDLKKTYWKTDYDFDVRYYTPLGKALGLDDLFTNEEISNMMGAENISVLDPILEGDLSFLCSFFLSDPEMKKLYSNQEKIEGRMNLSLSDLSDDKNIPKIKSALKPEFPNSYKRISKKINEKAKYWDKKLNKNENTTKK